MIEVKDLSTINKHIASIFQNGNSFAVRLPHSIASLYGMDRQGYALVQPDGEKGIKIKRIYN
jgi:hypothetical protein